jgi:hypothetical protein
MNLWLRSWKAMLLSAVFPLGPMPGAYAQSHSFGAGGTAHWGGGTGWHGGYLRGGPGWWGRGAGWGWRAVPAVPLKAAR